MLSAILAGIGLAEAAQHGRIALPDWVRNLLPPMADVAQFAGLGLDQISVTGQKFTSDSDVFAALGLDAARQLVGFDSKAARMKIEALPWVETVELTRVYPSQLNVRITERTAYAVWQVDGVEKLIDKTGRVLQDIAAGSVTHLPRVAGAGANKDAQNLMMLLGGYRDIYGALSAAVRVNERRWSLVLANGSRIELPADGESMALAAVVTGGRLAQLLSRGPVIVDLRAKGRIAVRAAPAKTAGRVRTVADAAPALLEPKRGEVRP
ncbi:MAG: FtsQ-type POTRA domain-containing protein [Hyphomicrobiaceae bacterium]|nr:FtsQ-type POTRA domain-containing protein [Hyphomicrobiaceae bacterium]